MKFYFFVILSALLFSISACERQYQQKVSYADQVNGLIGNIGSGHENFWDSILTSGNTFPGAACPFGMVQFTPTVFLKDKGFVVNQMSGTGCENMGNFPTLPLNGGLEKSPNGMDSLNTNPTPVKSVAGYYRVRLNSGIDCRLTATIRTGMAKYLFPDNQNEGTVIIGSGISSPGLKDARIRITSANSCEGYADGGNFCGSPTPYKVYFVAQFDRDAINTGTWKGAQLKPSIDSVEGANSGAYFTFDLSGSRTINYKFGISYVSKENARENLQKENPGFHFEQVAANATNLWNKYLSKIEVSGGNSQHTTLFYTSLYHALLHPSVFNDVNGQYVGSDGEVYVAKDFNYYTAFSNWDTYRTQIQLLSVLEPDKASDIVRSLILFAQRGGGSFPRWVVANYETGIMQGDPTSIIVSNGYAFGARDFDHDLALTIMRRGAEQPDARCQSTLTRPHLKEYLEKGYLSDASMLLEYTSADFAIGQFALQAFNDTSLFNKYLLRAQYWKNIYNPDTRWLNSRNEDGSWRAYYEGWREGSYKNYFWMVPYSLKSLMDTIGGLTAAQQRLDSLFIRLDALFYFDPKQNPTWFSMGNQPDFGAPWVYNWAGAPFKTQEVVRRIIETQYHNKLDGLPGNEDMGAMGSWYVFANLGLYPEIPGVAGFSINSPAFPYIKIHLPNGELEITGGSEDKYYIETLELNGHNYDQTWLPWTKIVKGAKLKFKLSEYPDKKWGLGKPPPSFGGEVRPPLFAEPRKPV